MLILNFDIKEKRKIHLLKILLNYVVAFKIGFYYAGKIVGEWFDVIPEQKSYLYGDGYRLLAKIKGPNL